jgi:hypothetical protein
LSTIQLDSDISTLYASLKQTEDERAKELSVYRLMMEQIDQVRSCHPSLLPSDLSESFFADLYTLLLLHQSVATLRRLPVDELTHWMELNLGKESISS